MIDLLAYAGLCGISYVVGYYFGREIIAPWLIKRKGW